MGLQQPLPSEATTQALRVQERILSFTQRNLCPPASTKGQVIYINTAASGLALAPPRGSLSAQASTGHMAARHDGPTSHPGTLQLRQGNNKL